MAIKLTYELAMAAARDAANQRMRASGRKKWSIGDHNLYCRTFDKLIPMLPLEDRLRLTGNAEGKLPK